MEDQTHLPSNPAFKGDAFVRMWGNGTQVPFVPFSVSAMPTSIKFEWVRNQFLRSKNG